MVRKQLGQGSTCVTYLASKMNGDSTCFVKAMLPGAMFSDIQDARKRFTKSIELQNHLRSLTTIPIEGGEISAIMNSIPYIVSEQPQEDENGTLFAEMSAQSGRTLSDRKDLNAEIIISIIIDIAGILDHLHKNGYLYLDLKPENIFIYDKNNTNNTHGLVQLIDFDSVTEKTKLDSATLRSTLPYCPFEVAYAEKDKISERSDVYSLGAILYELLYCLEPQHWVDRVSESDFFYESRYITPINYAARIAINDLLRGMLNFDPEKRPDIPQVISALKKIQGMVKEPELHGDLPQETHGFFGRINEMNQLTQLLETDKHCKVCLYGMNGVGKSALAIHFAHSWKGRVFFSEYMDCAESSVTAAVKTENQGSPGLADIKRMLGYSEYDALLIIANVPAEADVSVLRNLNCRVIITGCCPFNGFEKILVDVPNNDVSVQIFHSIYSRELRYDEGETSELISYCGDLPCLAVILAEYANSHKCNTRKIINTVDIRSALPDDVISIIGKHFGEAPNDCAEYLLRILSSTEENFNESTVLGWCGSEVLENTLAALKNIGWIYDADGVLRCNPAVRVRFAAKPNKIYKSYLNLIRELEKSCCTEKLYRVAIDILRPPKVDQKKRTIIRTFRALAALYHKIKEYDQELIYLKKIKKLVHSKSKKRRHIKYNIIICLDDMGESEKALKKAEKLCKKLDIQDDVSEIAELKKRFPESKVIKEIVCYTEDALNRSNIGFCIFMSENLQSLPELMYPHFLEMMEDNRKKIFRSINDDVQLAREELYLAEFYRKYPGIDTQKRQQSLISAAKLILGVEEPSADAVEICWDISKLQELTENGYAEHCRKHAQKLEDDLRKQGEQT